MYYIIIVTLYRLYFGIKLGFCHFQNAYIGQKLGLGPMSKIDIEPPVLPILFVFSKNICHCIVHVILLKRPIKANLWFTIKDY